jgi:putative flavoprotein involved in K+ transport
MRRLVRICASCANLNRSQVLVPRRSIVSTPTEQRDVVVIGAGPAGLATAGALRRRGVDALVVERAAHVGASWRGHYDRLHLHTVRWLSGLPGLRIPKSEGRWVSRDGVVRYLDRYVAHHGLEVRTGVSISRIERDGAGWRLVSPQGDLPRAQVVVATGYNHTRLIPDWPGKDAFGGELLHVGDYRNGEQFAGRDVLVVGAGNTGAEVAVDLAEHGAARVRLAYRTPPHILLRELNGVPAQVTGVLMRRMPTRLADMLAEPVRRRSVPNLRQYGLPDPIEGVYTRANRGETPILDVGLVAMIQQRRVEPVPAVERFDGPSVVLADGSAIEPEVVIAATGYRRGLESLVGHLGVLQPDGRPRVHGARVAPSAPGLRFVGYTNPVSGMFREIAIDARRIGRAVARDLQSTSTPLAQPSAAPQTA